MKRVDTDFLVIGSGVSGLYAALQLSEFGSVTVVTKEQAFQSNTYYAQGGVASVLADTDSFESHIEDTLNAGAGLCDPAAVEIMVREGPAHIRKLMELGARFEMGENGELDLGREGGHSNNRIVHSADMTGREIENVLVKSVKARNISLLEFHSVVELITDYHLLNRPPENEAKNDHLENFPACYGAYIYDRKKWDIYAVCAKAVILATGGAGQVYLHNTNPDVATGDGVALAYRAGAVISNMEFFQFHPTALYSPVHKTILITEALRGYGAILRNLYGEQFMKKYDDRGELAPRDIVARAIDAELKRGGFEHVWLDISHKDADETLKKFPNITEICRERGIDITREPIPVVPAAHYMCGGVKTDMDGRTNIPNLFAVGEVSFTGVHGGNRLASNSLLEGLVFANRIADYLKQNQTERQEVEIQPWQKDDLENADEWILVRHNLEEIKKLMWDYVGIVRSNLRLNRALRRIKVLYNEVEDFYRRTRIQNKILELRNLTLVSRLIIESALQRKESRGLHYNINYPENRETSTEYTNLRREN